MIDKLLAKKSLQDLSREASDTTHVLKRVLGPWHLIFLGIGLISGLVARIPPSEMVLSFISGAKDAMNVTLIIAGGRAILIILKEAVVLDSVLQFTVRQI